METIRASVNSRLLTKASRLFTGTLAGRIIEILQNARRAGASMVEITNKNGEVTVQDNGQGIADFRKLLDLGGSGWEESFEESEDPAGVGLFCLAPRAVCIRSLGGVACIAGDGWTGAPVTVRSAPEPIHGTRLQFQDEPWDHATVEPLAVFTGMDVTVDGQACAKEPFVSEQAVHYPELGCRIEVREAIALKPWQERVLSPLSYGDCVLVNFHGQTLSLNYRPVAERGLRYLVDLDGQPTGIRLMLPARTRIVENQAFDQLKAALEREAYRYLQKRGHHRLPYKQYLRGRELGIDMPEATPTFHVGLLHYCDPPEPVEVKMPDGFPLARCYRFDPSFPGGGETDEANAHLLAALGRFEEPFVPVSIHKDYDGYSWSQLPTIERVEVRAGKGLHDSWIWSGTINCVKSLRITAHTSDGKAFSSAVCMAKEPPTKAEAPSAEDHVLVTPEAEHRVDTEQIWYHLGGWWNEGDTYDTQLSQFSEELDRFWLNLRGPDEQLRLSILAALDSIGSEWEAVLVTQDGCVEIEYANRSTKTIQPPAAISAE